MPAQHKAHARARRGIPELPTPGLRNVHRHAHHAHRQPRARRRRPLERGRPERIVVHEHHERAGSGGHGGKPPGLGRADAAHRVADRDRASLEAQRCPHQGNGVEDGDARAGWQRLHERRTRRKPGGAPGDRVVEAEPAAGEERRRIPEPQRQPHEIGAAARMAAARRQIVVAVEDGRAVCVQQTVSRKTVEDSLEQRRVSSDPAGRL